MAQILYNNIVLLHLYEGCYWYIMPQDPRAYVLNYSKWEVLELIRIKCSTTSQAWLAATYVGMHGYLGWSIVLQPLLAYHFATFF